MVNIDSLVDYVAVQTGSTKKAAREAIYAMWDGVTLALAEGEDVHIRGYLKIGATPQEGRNGNNPQTGEKIYIQPYNRLNIRAGERLKQAVN